MLVSQTNNGNTDYFLQDAQNSTIGIADSSGAVTSSYAYDAFGNLDSSISGVSVETNYLYTGQQFDPVYTELYNLRARQYDPSIGRFSSRDKWAYDLGNPIELNRYGYSQNNPVNFYDPSGYSSLFDTASVKSWVTTVASKPLSSLRNNVVSGLTGAFVGHVFGSMLVAVGRFALDMVRQFLNPDYNLQHPPSNPFIYFWDTVSRLDVLVPNLLLGGVIGVVNTYTNWRVIKKQDNLVRLANHPYSGRAFNAAFSEVRGELLNRAFINGLITSGPISAVVRLQSDDVTIIDIMFDALNALITGIINRGGLNDAFLDEAGGIFRRVARGLGLNRAFANSGVYALSNTISVWGASGLQELLT